MNKAHLELIQLNYEKACDAYVKAFARQLGRDGQRACMGDDTYKYAVIGNRVYDFSLIRFVVDNQMSKEDFTEWEEYNQNCDWEKHITIEDWHEGHRVSDEVMEDCKNKAEEKYTL